MAQILLAMLVCVVSFARTSTRRFVETYCRDLAALLGYAIPLLVMCSLALTLGTIAVRRGWGVDLRFQLSYLSWACLCVIIIGAMYVWRTNVRAAVGNRRGELE